MAAFLDISKGFLSRVLFICHGVITVYFLVLQLNHPKYWALMVGCCFQFIELLYTVGVRKGLEYKYFWPSGFFYMSTILPAIWIIEMDLLNERITARNAITNAPTNSTSSDPGLKVAGVFLSSVTKEAIGKKIGELGLIIGIIVGRWLMPRGQITRDQLSALLLGYVGNAADIIELFETFEEPGIIYNRGVTISILTAYTWSIYQFTLVTTATIKSDLEEPEKKEQEIDRVNGYLRKYAKNSKVHPSDRKMSTASVLSKKTDATQKQQYIQEIRAMRNSVTQYQPVRGHGSRGSSRDSVTERPRGRFLKSRDFEADERKQERRRLHGELFQILVTLCMQDGPFLVLRLLLIIEFNITSEIHIFFTAKNAIVSILLVYRMLILTCRGEDTEDSLHKEEASAKLHNVQLAVLSAQFMKSGNIKLNP